MWFEGLAARLRVAGRRRNSWRQVAVIAAMNALAGAPTCRAPLQEKKKEIYGARAPVSILLPVPYLGREPRYHGSAHPQSDAIVRLACWRAGGTTGILDRSCSWPKPTQPHPGGASTLLAVEIPNPWFGAPCADAPHRHQPGPALTVTLGLAFPEAWRPRSPVRPTAAPISLGRRRRRRGRHHIQLCRARLITCSSDLKTIGPRVTGLSHGLESSQLRSA